MKQALYIIDTNVISETTKPRPNPKVIAWLSAQTKIVLSSVTVYELKRGIQGAESERKRQFLEAWFAELLDGPCEVVPFGVESALLAADLETHARRKGRSIDTRDLFIIASAKARGLSVATRNVSHFQGFGVPLLNPFLSES